MPQVVEDCVKSILDENPDYDESQAYAVCWSKYDEGELGKASDCAFVEDTENLAKDENLSREDAAAIIAASRSTERADTKAIKSVAYRTLTDDWGDYHPSESTMKGREHLLNTFKSEVDSLLKEFSGYLDGVTVEVGDSDEEEETTEKSLDDDREPHTVKFKMESSRGIMPLFKAENGDMIVWGPASVEVVDKEGDRIRASALEDALPQLLRRQRLSLEHTDQLVGEILDSFETDEEVTVSIDGKSYTRKDFPTDVLELDGIEPSLFVCGKIWDDTRQSREAQTGIENGELDSYSISGESLVATTKYEQGDVVNDIKELDLSAVTLCEQGMNQKAKFGVVSKADGDIRTDEVSEEESEERLTSKRDRGPAGIQSEPTIKIVKSMTENNESEEDEEPETVSLDDVRSEFKSVVDDALPSDDLATKSDMMTKEDVESVVEEKSLTKDDVRSIAQEVSESVYEEKATATVEGEEVSASTDAGEVSASDDSSSAEEKGEDYEEDEMDEETDDEEKENEPPLDEEEEDEDEEFPMEEDEKAGVDLDVLEEELPEDLYDAVCEYMGEEDEGEMVEMEDDGSLTEEDVEKMIEERFGDEMALDSPSGPTEDVQKSWDDEDDSVTESDVGPAARQLYDQEA